MAGTPNEPDEADAQLRWLVEPPAADGVKFAIRTSDATTLSPTARDALEAFLDEIQGGEVATYAWCDKKLVCASLNDCLPMTCGNLNSCWPLTRKNCLIDVQCNIQPCAM